MISDFIAFLNDFRRKEDAAFSDPVFVEIFLIGEITSRVWYISPRNIPDVVVQVRRAVEEHLGDTVSDKVRIETERNVVFTLVGQCEFCPYVRCHVEDSLDEFYAHRVNSCSKRQ